MGLAVPVADRAVHRSGLHDRACLGHKRRGETEEASPWTSVAVNLSILGVFKYLGFFAESLNSLLDTLGAGVLAPSINIVLPVGISFYTFQTISYTFDVYRRDLPAERDLIDFALYVSFFPQLVAGPIERAAHFVPQIKRQRLPLTYVQFQTAVGLLALGLFKKVVVADTLAQSANQAFGDTTDQSSINLLFGVYAFAFQIYADFSAYSDLARGSAGLLGFDLLKNFEQPYLAPDIQTFWRRWHISLSNWLRDYLYIPLGGNRSSAARTSINLALVMLLGGLWHGASWNFVIWGALHGTFLVAHRTFRPTARPASLPRVRDLPAILVTFHAVCFAWIFFRADTLGGAVDYLRGLARLDLSSVNLIEHLWLGLVMLGIDVAQRRSGSEVFFLGWRPQLRGAAFAAFALSVLIYSGAPAAEFVYFQF